jgi:hypothetical protein
MNRRIVRWDNAHSATHMIEGSYWFTVGWSDLFDSNRVAPTGYEEWSGRAQLQTRNGLVVMLI